MFKIQKYKANVYFVLVVRLAIALVFLCLSRVSIYIFNADLFSGFQSIEIFKAIFFGLRFDLSVLAILASLMILGNALPLGFRRNAIYQTSISLISVIAISIAIVFNFIDTVYFRFTLKRMTFDIFNYLESNGGFLELGPQFLIDFWYVSLTAIASLAVFVFLFYHFHLNRKIEKTSWRFYLWNSLIFLLSVVLIIIGIRGGSQLKPINIVDAGLHAPTRLSPVVLNTPFSIIKSYGQTGFDLKNDFSDSELKDIYNPIQSYQALISSSSTQKNVIVLILESFSAEHIGYFTHKKSFTPFLDSLFNHSLVYKGIANGKRSIEGIPAILSGLPTLSNESFLNGPYAANQIEGLAATLNKYDYKTAFFHGGKNGTMSLDAYAYASGFQEYFGLNEYPNKEQFDGHWGIWDEEYLQYFSKKISSFPQPFMASLFTLSSHHPYKVPEQYLDKLPEGKLPIQKAIAYTDLSLRKFFESVKDKDWYENTLFVLVADHTSEGSEAAYQNAYGQFSIPIAFYSPNDSSLSTRPSKKTVQQTDIFPSILHYLGIEDPILAFGESVFVDSQNPKSINFYNHMIQVIDSSYIMQSQNDKTIALYNYKEDSLLKNNLKDKKEMKSFIQFRKAFIQQYNNRMIHNKLKAKNNE